MKSISRLLFICAAVFLGTLAVQAQSGDVVGRFDFGFGGDDGVAEGYTAVTSSTKYSVEQGYGIMSGRPKTGGEPSTSDATSDYLQGAFEFDVKLERGDFYTVEVTYQGVLTTGHINDDLAGYELGTHEVMSTDTYTIPATKGYIDLHISGNDIVSVAQLARVTVTRQPKRQRRQKPAVLDIGDSTAANNGAWAYRLQRILENYPELAELCEFWSRGAGGRNLSTYYTQGRLAAVLREICPGDILMLGNMGTNGMGTMFEADVNYYLDAAEALGARIIMNSYSPHGAVGNWSGGYDAATHTFDSYRRDAYETIIRKVAAERAASDANYLGFVEIGQNADAAFNAYVNDHAASGGEAAEAAAQAIIRCYGDHNHYFEGSLVCELLLDGYGDVDGIVAQLTRIVGNYVTTDISQPAVTAPVQAADRAIYTLQGQRVSQPGQRGIYIIGGRKVIQSSGR